MTNAFILGGRIKFVHCSPRLHILKMMICI